MTQALKIGLPPARLIIFSILILLALPLADAMKPARIAATERWSIAEAIPPVMGPWRMVANDDIVLPKGRDFNQLGLYDKELARAYKNDDGDLIFLVVAYGDNQSDALQLHRPEICYVAAGFDLLHRQSVTIAWPRGNDLKGFPATYLETRRIHRFEAITYWTRVGDSIPANVVSLQLAKLWSGLRGEIPDGTLVRISSPGPRRTDARALHQNFIQHLLTHIPASAAPYFIGPTAD